MTEVSSPSTSITRDIGRVSREGLGDHVAVPAEQHHAAQPDAHARRPGRRTTRPWRARRPPRRRGRRPAARTPRRAGWWPWSRRRSATPSTCAEVGDPVAVGREGRAARRGPRTAGTPTDRARAAAASALATKCGAGEARSRDACTARRRWCSRSSTNARSASTSSTRPTMPTRRGAEGEADRAGALDDVGVAHQLLGDRVGDVVDAGGLHPLVDPALVGGVVGHPVGPVYQSRWSSATLSTAAGVRGHRGGVVQLEAGQLDGVHGVGLGVHHGLDDRQPDVAAGDAVAGRRRAASCRASARWWSCRWCR